jgi:hypothetical protein
MVAILRALERDARWAQLPSNLPAAQRQQLRQPGYRLIAGLQGSASGKVTRSHTREAAQIHALSVIKSLAQKARFRGAILDYRLAHPSGPQTEMKNLLSGYSTFRKVYYIHDKAS